MKKFMAMVLAATLAFGSSVMVFADDANTGNDTVAPAVEGEAPAEEAVPEAPVAVVEEPVVEEVVEEVIVNIPFAGVTKDYINAAGLTVAQYVSFSDNDTFSKTMEDLVNDTYQDLLANQPQLAQSTDVDLIISFTVEEILTAAKIEYTLNNITMNSTVIESPVIATYYVDKATNKEMTAEAYAARVAEEEGAAPAEEVAPGGEVPAEEVVESVMLPLRAYAESLGYVVAWEDGRVTVSKDDVTVSLVTGSTTYVNAAGEEVELEAPENIDGTLYVPMEFFTVLLGVEVTVEAPAAEAAAPVEEVVEGEEVPSEEVVEDEEAPAADAAEGEAAPADDAAEAAPVA